MGEETGSDNRTREVKLQKSYFDVLGLCCSSEIPLIEKTLNPLEGIEKVTVIVPSKTVIVVHDSLIISQLQIVKALNQARLEASIRAYDTEEIVKRWPNPSILACGLLLVVSLFHHYFRPLKWLALAAVAVGLPTIILRSIAALRRCTLDINTLMLIAVGGAIAMKDYSEAAFIVLLFTVAEWLESRASHKATAGMSSLMSMAPQKAVLAETGQVVDSQDVKINTILAVKAGEVIPIDGIVVEGRSEVDERSLTGESFPVPKQAQSLVWAGTLNIDGYISVQTTALAEHSAVAKMAGLVEEAQNSRSNTQRLIDSCAKYYTPAVVILAAVIAVVPLIAGVHRRKKWFQLALVLLVSACPCALVLSTPVATFCSLLKASRMGLLIKGGDVLEALAKTRVVALDKTGTITRGEFIVVNFRSINDDISLEKLLYWVASIESKSSHPMASALVDYARSNSIEPNPEHVTEFQIHPGEGIYGEIDGREIYVGNRRLATRAACQTAPNMEDIEEGVTVGYVFSDAVPVGIFTLSDNCRTGAAEAIRELKSLGIKTAMVTGDSNGAARHTQNQLGHTIDMVHAELLPEDKVRIIEDLKTKEGSTTMVGDGMNDAPALAAADVGISMGISGSAVAMETSHITLMSNDVRKIPKAIRLARRTHRKIITNIIFSVSTKIAIVALAFAGYPLVWAAVLADVGTCLIVILNSMMLLQTRKAKEKKCCGSSHKSHAPKPVCTDHCDGGTHGSQSKCCQSKGVGSLHTNGCNQHHKEEEGRAHGHCLSTCEKRTCHNDSANHSHRSPESIPGATKATDEHLVSVTSEEEHNEHVLCEHLVKHNDHHEHGPCKHSVKHSDHHHHEHGPCKHSVKHSDHHEHGLCEHSVKHTDHHEHGPNELSVKHNECAHKADVLETGKAKGSCGNQPVEHACLLSQICKNTDKKQVGGCCGSTMEVHSKKDGCSSLEECTEIREEAGCCRSVRKECGIKDGCSSQPTTCMDKRESSGCCSSDRKEECCSSSPICMDKREIGKCCSSYRKGYGLKDGCCGGRTLQLPEIIVE